MRRSNEARYRMRQSAQWLGRRVRLIGTVVNLLRSALVVWTCTVAIVDADFRSAVLWWTACVLFVAEALDIYKLVLRDRLNTAARRADWAEAAGIPISADEEADFASDALYPYAAPPSRYFATIAESDVQRATEALLESAFFTKSLSRAAKRWSLGFVAGLVMLWTFALLYGSGATPELRMGIAQAVLTVIVSFAAFGGVRAAIAYRILEEAANNAERTALDLLGRKQIEWQEAFLAWANYHAAREYAPLVPTWLWLLKRKSLNTLHSRRRARPRNAVSGIKAQDSAAT